MRYNVIEIYAKLYKMEHIKIRLIIAALIVLTSICILIAAGDEIINAESKASEYLTSKIFEIKYHQFCKKNNDMHKAYSEYTDDQIYNQSLYNKLPKLKNMIGLASHDMRKNVINQFPSKTYHIIRDDVDWNYVETSKGHYRYDKYLNQLLAYKKEGVKGECIFTFNNKLYSHNGDEKDNIANEERVHAYKKFVVEFVKYMKSQGITGLIIEIINEPNVDIFFSSQGDYVKQYVEIVKPLYQEIKEIDNTALIVTCNFAAGEGFHDKALKDLDKALNYGIADCSDAISIHTYVNGIPENNNEYYNRLNFLVRNIHGIRIPLICGEIGYSVCKSDNYEKGYKILASEEERLKYIPRSILNNVRYGFLWTVIYCHRKVDEDISTNSETLFGIFNMDGSPTKTAKEIDTLIEEIGDLVYAGVYLDDGSNVALQFIDKNGIVSYVAWSYCGNSYIVIDDNYYYIGDRPKFIKGNTFKLKTDFDYKEKISHLNVTI